jgi:hypothetical protein
MAQRSTFPAAGLAISDSGLLIAGWQVGNKVGRDGLGAPWCPPEAAEANKQAGNIYLTIT